MPHISQKIALHPGLVCEFLRHQNWLTTCSVNDHYKSGFAWATDIEARFGIFHLVHSLSSTFNSPSNPESQELEIEEVVLIDREKVGSRYSSQIASVPPPEPPKPLKERSGLGPKAKNYLDRFSSASCLLLAVEWRVKHFPKFRAHLRHIQTKKISF